MAEPFYDILTRGNVFNRLISKNGLKGITIVKVLNALPFETSLRAPHGKINSAKQSHGIASSSRGTPRNDTFLLAFTMHPFSASL